MISFYWCCWRQCISMLNDLFAILHSECSFTNSCAAATTHLKSYQLAMGIKTKLFQSAARSYRWCAMHNAQAKPLKWKNELLDDSGSLNNHYSKIITNMQVSIKSQHENSMAWIAIADFSCDVQFISALCISHCAQCSSIYCFYFCESHRFWLLPSWNGKFNVLVTDLGRIQKIKQKTKTMKCEIENFWF